MTHRPHRTVGGYGEASVTLGHRCSERARPGAGGARSRAQHRIGPIRPREDADGRVHAALAVHGGLGVL